MSKANTLYCTIDTFRVKGNKSGTNPEAIKQAIKKVIYTLENYEG